MSTEDFVAEPLSMRELATVLIRHFDLKEGLYETAIEFQIGTGPIGPDLENLVPGALIGINRISLRLANPDSRTAVDAAKVNGPVKPARKPKKTAS